METQMSARSLSLYLSLLQISLLPLLVPSPCHSDPDPLQDFCVANLEAHYTISVNGFPCKAASDVVADDFFFDGLPKEGELSKPFGFRPNPANVFTFPALNTLGVSMGRNDFARGGVIPPHSHPRATELILVIKGTVHVGFVSTANVLFSKVLKAGEMFVVPKGLLHFQYNVGEGKALAFSSFSSQLPGTVFSSASLFASEPSIPDQVLAKAFKVDEELVSIIKSKFGS